MCGLDASGLQRVQRQRRAGAAAQGRGGARRQRRAGAAARWQRAAATAASTGGGAGERGGAHREVASATRKKLGSGTAEARSGARAGARGLGDSDRDATARHGRRQGRRTASGQPGDVDELGIVGATGEGNGENFLSVAYIAKALVTVRGTNRD